MKSFNLYSGVVVPAVVAIERQIFFLTGLRLPVLAAYWRHRSETVQRLLDMQHALWRE